MFEWIPEISFSLIGWAGLQFLWISTLAIGATAGILKLLDASRSIKRYRMVSVLLVALLLVPGLLWVEHTGALPSLGIADWRSPEKIAEQQHSTREDRIIPEIKRFDLGSYTGTIYYWFGVVWVGGACLMMLYFLVTHWLVLKGCRTLPKITDPSLNEQIGEIAGKLQLKFAIQVRKWDAGKSPATTGFWSPQLIIPDGFCKEYTNDEIRSILMHELIHIKRKDYLYALLQRFVCSLLFIQPLVWWLGSIVDREREHLCDERVVRNNDAHLYARALVKLQQKTKPTLSLGLNAVESNVVSRIRRLTLCEQGYESNILKFIAIISFILVLAGMAWSSYHLHYIL